MNELPLLYAKDFGIAMGQTLQVATRKCIVKSYFNVQKKNDFGGRSTLFHHYLDNVDLWKV